MYTRHSTNNNKLKCARLSIRRMRTLNRQIDDFVISCFFSLSLCFFIHCVKIDLFKMLLLFLLESICLRLCLLEMSIIKPYAHKTKTKKKLTRYTRIFYIYIMPLFITIYFRNVSDKGAIANVVPHHMLDTLFGRFVLLFIYIYMHSF